MKAKQSNSLDQTDANRISRVYTVEITPRTWWGRAIAVAVVAALLSSVFLFFSLLVAIGAAIVVLTFVIGTLKYLAKGPPRPGGQVDQHKLNVIDTERSENDGVYRSRS
jgi:hypothetical protein